MNVDVKHGRTVVTLEDPWPIGTMTYYVDEVGAGVLEHIIPFRPIFMRRLMQAGLDYAWAEGMPHVRFYIPGRHPMRRALIALGRRMGFEEYAPTWWLMRKPKERT